MKRLTVAELEARRDACQRLGLRKSARAVQARIDQARAQAERLTAYRFQSREGGRR